MEVTGEVLPERVRGFVQQAIDEDVDEVEGGEGRG